MSTGAGDAGAVVVSEYVVNLPAGATTFYPSRNTASPAPGLEDDATRLRPGGPQSYWLPLFEPDPGPYDLVPSANAPVFPSYGIFRFQKNLAAPGSSASPELATQPQVQRPYNRASQFERWEVNRDFGRVRIRDAVRLLLNVRRETGGRRRPATVTAPDRQPSNGGNGGSTLAAILDLPLDPEMLELFFSVVTPSLEPSGLISFSIAGLGNFVMVLSEEIGALKIIDLDRGNTVVLRGSSQGLSAQSRQNLDSIPGRQRRGAASQITIPQFIRIVRQFLLAILQDLRFISVLVIFSLLWLIWILYRRRA